MKEITRYIDATETTDYILPAIQLVEYSLGIKTIDFKRYGKRAIHIGIDKGKGNVACLCGKHHNRDNREDWKVLKDVEKYPDITCGGCLRSMKSIIKSASTKPYILIMKKLGQKLKDAKFHVTQKGSTSSSSEPCDIDPVSRVIEGDITDPLPRLRADGNLLTCCRDVFGSIYGPIHAAHENGFGLVSFCGKGNNLALTFDGLDIYPNITCPDCAKMIRISFPDTAPERLNECVEACIQKYVYIDHLKDELKLAEKALQELEATIPAAIKKEVLDNLKIKRKEVNL